MDNQEISKFLEQYKVTGSQSESIDVPFSPGSQDSISNIHLDFDPDALGLIRPVDINDLDFNVPFQQQQLPISEACIGRLISGLPEMNDLKLEVSFESQPLPVTKSTAWTFSESQNRLYVKISQPCPVRFRMLPFPLLGSMLRCFLRYQKSAYVNEPVTQCPNHLFSENNVSLKGHVLRCKQVDVQYEKDIQGRCSLCLPFDQIQDDGDGGTCVFEFKCLSTCPSLNRRATELVFQVEHSGTVVCCQSVSVRVCSCPGRDRRHDENPMKNPILSKSKMKSEHSGVPHSGAKRRLDDNEEFTITVKGRKNYELMLALNERLEMADAFESQVAEGKPDAEMASPKAKMSMTMKERIPAKEPLKDQANGVIESADGDRSHHRWRPHHHSQLQPSQNLLTGKIKKNKALPLADVNAVNRA